MLKEKANEMIIQTEKFFSWLDIETERKGVKKNINVWAENKQDIYSLFGNKLKIEKDVNTIIGEFEFNNLKFQTLTSICRVLNISKYDHDILFVKEFDKTNIHHWSANKIRIGKQDIKLTKFLVNLLPNKDEIILTQNKTMTIGEYVNIECSKLIQLTSIRAVLVLSIHPLDYFTMSYSGYGWRSCHNIIDGEYRAGTLSYMNDSTTIIAYLKTRVFEEFNILDKKMWRACVYIDTDSQKIKVSRHYPDNKPELNNIIGSMFGALFGQEMKKDNESNAGCFRHDNSLFYNDSSYYNTIDYYVTYNPSLTIGYTPYCLKCGNKIYNREELYCDEHLNVLRCNICNTSLNSDYANYDDYENVYCDDCFNDNFAYCYHCNELHRIQDMQEINREGYFLRRNRYYVCDDCLSDYYTECEQCADFIHNDDINNDFSLCDDCFNDNYIHCDICDNEVEIDDFNHDSNMCNECYNSQEHEIEIAK